MSSEPILWYAYTSYPALCSYFGVPVKKGGAKVKQLEHWREYFDWELEGHKYIITDVYGPLIPQKMQGPKETKFSNIGKIILCMTKYAINGYGVNQPLLKYRELIVSSVELYEIVGLCNHKFKKLKKGWKDESGLSSSVNKRCYIDIGGDFYRLVTRVLKSLQRKEIIIYARAYVVIGDPGSPRLASLEEEKTIIDLRNDLLDKYHVKSEFYLIGKKYEGRFYDDLNHGLSIKYPQLKSCYKVHRVNFHDDVREYSDVYQYTSLGCDIFRQEINDTIVEDLSSEKYDIPQELIQYAILQKCIGDDIFENIRL